MALDFSSHLTHIYIGHGTMNNWSGQSGTILEWIYPTNVNAASDQTLFLKGTSWDNSLWFDIEWQTNGIIKIGRGRATDQCRAVSTDTLSNNTWQFVAATWDVNGSNTDQKLFIGTLASAVSEVSGYSDQTVGAGTVSTVPDSKPVQIGDGIGEFAWETGYAGRIAWVGVWNRTLSLGEIQAQQFRPHVTNGCLLFSHYGYSGVGTQADWSGNVYNGTPSTTITSVNHVPISPNFGFDIGWTSIKGATVYNSSVSGSNTPVGNTTKQAQITIGAI